MTKTIETITVDKHLLMEALTNISSGYSGMPNPDDNDLNNSFAPYGPGSPVLRDQFSAHYSKILTRRFIQAIVMNSVQHGTFQLANARALIAQYVEDYCGNRWPRPFPFPPEPPRPWWWREFEPGEPRPIDLIAAGLEFYYASKAVKGNDLQPIFEDASNRLIRTGLNATEAGTTSS